MHLADVIHGDLTTSNMMVRLIPPTPEDAKTESTSPTPVFELVRLPFLEPPPRREC